MATHLHQPPVVTPTASIPPSSPHYLFHHPHSPIHGNHAAHRASDAAAAADSPIARWLQSSGTPLPADSVDHASLSNFSIQGFPRYSGQSFEDKQKMFKLIKNVSNGVEPPPHPTTPPIFPGSGNRFKSSMEAFLSPELKGDLVSGILDLHAIDTELLSETEVTMPGLLESTSPLVPVIQQGFENDSDAVPYAGKQLSGRSQNQIDFSPMRSNFTERERGAKDLNSLAKIKVVVRKRPINKKELTRKEEDIIAVEGHGCSLTVHEPKLKVDLTAYVEKHEFIFDAVLDEDVSNDEVYQETVEPIVPTIFQRTKATCFAYGQTGSGKTYTMQPLPLKASQHILNLMQHANYRNQGYLLWLSFFEIYGGKLFDLLNERSKLCMREDGRQQVCIVGLREFQVSDVELVKEYIEKGNAARSIGSTGANEESSRSHAILQLSIKKCPDGNELRPGRLVGKLSFIDLAGSERGADTTDNDRQTRLEGAEINKSLLALKECIRALDNDQVHIPFRGSKLTEVLRDSFVGNSRTVMISCISPSSGSCEHTLNTLRYADRVKGLSKNNSSKKDFNFALPLQRDSAALTFFPSSPAFDSSESNGELTEDAKQAYNQDCENLPALSTDFVPVLSKDESRMALAQHYMGDSNDNALEFGMYPASVGNHFENQEQEKLQIVLPSGLKSTRDGRSDKQLNVDAKEVTYEKRSKDLPMHSSIAELHSSQQDEHQETALVKEEEELLSAHCKEVEETIEIVREEMKLLGEIDKPGGRIDCYVFQLNRVLSKKAAGLVNLQGRLARFQRLLKNQAIPSHTTSI